MMIGLLYFILRWIFGLGALLVVGFLLQALGVYRPENYIIFAGLAWTAWGAWSLLRWLRTQF